MLFGAEFTQNEGWDLGPDALGATSLIDGALSIVVPRPNLTRLVRSPGASAHDLVLAASFQTEVCQAEDEYGLALLLSPAGDHLRFTVTCAGGLRVRRVVGGESRALEPFVPRDPMVNAGAPVHNRLVARVQGNDLLLYVNDVPVVHTTAPPLPAGGTGVVVQTDDVGDQATIVVEEFILYDLESNHTPAPDGTEIPDG